ncbi:FMN reductase (NADPH) [Carbonactinospora thermoautotrophica]|uniref:NADPH-dependent FMN reductase n=1 Tax=Carbonactinospora thermoautotrophica TaxID=1469144 RepID=UPI00226E087E|nr:NADPH-dependent FMN reductase [Carbonactinospora thermoautotrophica]MCX9190059.1 FMN reductase (NADPH) [Carbonactinospora thermoautotrophica]
MARILLLSGSPSASSRTRRVLDHVAARLAGHTVRTISARDLPPGPLLAADTAHPAIAELVAAVDDADGLVVASPVYKAAYTGLLKAALDLLPQYALAGKVVLPLATGGTTAHVLAIDYALRPVLTSLGARHVVQGYFLLDQLITVAVDETGRERVVIDPQAEAALFEVVDGFLAALRNAVPDTPLARVS